MVDKDDENTKYYISYKTVSSVVHLYHCTDVFMGADWVSGIVDDKKKFFIPTSNIILVCQE